MKHTRFKVKITLLEEMLGTKAADPEIFKTYIASKHPKGTPERDEIESADRSEIAGTTGFHRDSNNRPFLYDYQIRGFLKEAAKVMGVADDSLSRDVSQLRSKIDTLVFVEPRVIRLHMPEKTDIGICERPLRAETMQGPRVALARSETVPAGTTLEFSVFSLVGRMKGKKSAKAKKGSQDTEVEEVESAASVPFGDLLEEWLGYGRIHGLGQWRNSGKGKFSFEILPEE